MGGATTTTTGSGRSIPSQLVGAAIDLLLSYSRSGKLNDPLFLPDICISLARGIDYAIMDNEVPLKSQQLPQLLQQINIWKHDHSVQTSFMILMMSVKGACTNGWFQKKDTEYLLSLVDEVKKFYSTEDRLHEACYDLHSIPKIMSRYYPKWMIESTLASVEVEPGYRTCVVDFSILQGKVAPEREKIGIIVARVDNMDTSSCIVTPQEVNFLVNGKGVPGRISTVMEQGPLHPTDITAMLKYGVNLLQAVGNFDGFEIIQKQSLTSLICPISRRRIRTPVKGHLCKHHQCFDYDNYLEINSKRPFWRCPLCNQPVCYPDIRVDQSFLKVLREAGENIVDVLISKDGSWKTVLGNKNCSSQTNGESPSCQDAGEKQGSSSSTIAFESRHRFLDDTQGDSSTRAIGTSQQVPGISNTQALATAPLPACKTRSTCSLSVVTKEEGEMHPISHDDGLMDLAPDHWRPSGRMRGSLQGQAYSEAFNQFLSRPTQPARVSEPPSRLMPTLPSATHIDAKIKDNISNTKTIAQAQGQPNTIDATKLVRSSSNTD